MKDFEKIYSEYFDTVFQYTLSLCKDEAWAEELTQEAFFKALKNIGTFRGECRLSVWLCQIAKNVFSEYVLCAANKGAERIDRVFYYTGDYTGIESMDIGDLQKIIDNSVLLWSK